MGSLRLRPAALLATLALAFPAGALAQGAGDSQYQDPLAGEEGQSEQGTGGGGGGQGGGGELQPAPPPGSEARAAQEPTPEGQLPATGADAWLTALLGAGLVLTGAGLRVRLREPVA
jgi:LPXTG-motif cell wall-anchored protein